jgi:uncharacterized membrane protein
VWLGLVAKGFYAKHLGFLLRSSPNWIAALFFYLVFVVGLLVFVIVPGLQRESAKWVLACGALFGLVTFATYDLTNLALLKDWPVVVTVVDLTWGTALGAMLSYVVFLMSRWLH